MPDIKVKVNQPTRVGQQNAVKVITAFSGDSSSTMSAMSDVDVSGGLQNGMVLVYNSSTSKWDATLDLTPGSTQNLDINGGNW
tara:strand:+ start:11024 stop:11272 length:249 start_codon:yes stop_codon:yes gene_type:complete